MLRTLLATAGLLLLVPSAAAAAPFGELPFRPVSGSATCLRATGTPGELVRQTERAIQFEAASPGGVTAGATLAADGIRGCADAASWPGGGGLVAFAVGTERQDEAWVRAYVREPGQAWGEPADVIPPTTDPFSSSVAVAASERGDALVAFGSVAANRRAELRVTRRLPGGAFGAPETLHSARTGDPYAPTIHAGFSASGEAIVLWTAHAATKNAERELWAAVAAPGAPFGKPQLIDPIADGAPFELTVAPDGRALVAFVSGDQLVAAERAPGGGFGYPFTVADTIDVFGSVPAAVLRPDGGALIAWAGLTDSTVTVRTREAPGIFGPPITIGRARRLEEPPLMSVLRLLQGVISGEQGEFGFSGAPPDTRATNPRALLGSDGRVLLTWGQVQRDDGIWRMRPRTALVNFQGGQRELGSLGGDLRNVDSLTPLLLADGSRAVAWTDNNSGITTEPDRGRVHLAREGSPDPAEVPAPKVGVSAPGSHVLKGNSPLALRVTCDAACDLYAQIAGHEEIFTELTLTAAGTRRVLLQPLLAPIPPRRGGPVRVLLRSSAPGTSTSSTRTFTVNLRRAKVTDVPTALGLRATRSGEHVVVRWRTAKPASPNQFFVLGIGDDDEPVADAELEGSSKRTSFSARLRDPGRAIDSVVVIGVDSETFETSRKTAKVRG